MKTFSLVFKESDNKATLTMWLVTILTFVIAGFVNNHISIVLLLVIPIIGFCTPPIVHISKGSVVDAYHKYPISLPHRLTALLFGIYICYAQMYFNASQNLHLVEYGLVAEEQTMIFLILIHIFAIQIVLTSLLHLLNKFSLKKSHK